MTSKKYLEIENKKLEWLLIALIWLVILAIPFLFLNYDRIVNWDMLLQPLETLGLVFLVFLINRFFLLPFLFFKGRILIYFISVALMIGVITILLIVFNDGQSPDKGQFPPFNANAQMQMPPPARRPPAPFQPQNNPKPLPREANFFLLAVLVVGFDTSLRMAIKGLEAEKEKAKLEKEMVSGQLEMLRHQVSPHFLMNTLNNIHTLIEIDTENAQKSVIRLSKLMRYLLYETGQGKTTIENEIAFISSYVELMKLRLSEKVEVRVNLDDQKGHLEIPPLLFTAFIENAFKHGISNQHPSFIHIDLITNGERLLLQVKNSNHAAKSKSELHGIGLENAKKRLDLIYGNGYRLDIVETDQFYSVNLSIPLMS